MLSPGQKADGIQVDDLGANPSPAPDVVRYPKEHRVGADSQRGSQWFADIQAGNGVAL